MKLKLITLSLAFAISPLFADTQADITELQAQINALQTEVNQMNQISSFNAIGLDTADPFGTLSKVQMPMQLLKNRGANPPQIVLGGQLEGDLQYWNGSNISTHGGSPYGNGQSGTSVALTKLYLFTEANLGQNALGFVSLKNTLPDNTIAFDRAFLMFGKLNSTSPMFLTVGSTYLPFGNFSGNGPLNNTLTTNVFRVSPTNQASANAVFGPVTLIASAFNNQSSVNDTINELFTAYLNEKFNDVHYNFGVSYLSNVVGTNSGLGAAFTNGSPTGSTPLHSGTNPVWDANFNIGIKPLSVLGEYATTTRAATNQNQSIGKLSSWMLGLTGQFAMWNSPYFWQVSYSKTANMQNVLMPLDGDYQDALKTTTGFKNQWIGSIQGEFWQNVYIGPEFTYGYLYNNAHTYTATLDATAYF